MSKTASRVLRGHSDDVSKFVVEEGMVVSGGRYDRCYAKYPLIDVPSF